MVDGIGRGGTLNTIGVEYRRSTLVATLIEHQRLSIGECGCGWNELGQSFALHVALAYEEKAHWAALIDGSGGTEPPHKTP